MTSTLATAANHQDNPRVSHPSWCQQDLCCAAVEPDRLSVSHRAILRFPEDDSLSVEILGGDVFDEAGSIVSTAPNTVTVHASDITPEQATNLAGLVGAAAGFAFGLAT
jgi:hypothetical protein